MKRPNCLLFCFLFALFTTLLLHDLTLQSHQSKLTRSYIQGDEFRSHELSKDMIELLKAKPPSERGKQAGLYLLQHNYPPEEEPFSQNKNWQFYVNCCNAIWQDIAYFPIPISTSHEEYQVSYEDSWMMERTYGGKRGHEGTDLIASENTPGLYPVLSMTDQTHRLVRTRRLQGRHRVPIRWLFLLCASGFLWKYPGKHGNSCRLCSGIYGEQWIRKRRYKRNVCHSPSSGNLSI